MNIQAVYISVYNLIGLRVRAIGNVGERVQVCACVAMAVYVTAGLLSSSVYAPFEVMLLY